MSDAKHTPGPWVKKSYQRDALVRPNFWVEDQHGEEIVHCGLEDEAEANADLIAAAPDLLAVVQGLVNDVAPGERTAPIIKKAYAAIAKATGDES